MVAYSFHKRFVPAVLAGLEPGPWMPGMKRHTLRADRRNGHARPGQRVDLYTGMRTRHCKLLGRAPAALQVKLALVFEGDAFHICRGQGPELLDDAHAGALLPLLDHFNRWQAWTYLGAADAEAFARADGFADLADMRAYWQQSRLTTEDCWFDMTLVAWAPPA